MLLYIGGTLCLMLGNLGVLTSASAGGLRIFSIVLLLMLLDAVDLHEPETPDRALTSQSSPQSSYKARGAATATGGYR